MIVEIAVVAGELVARHAQRFLGARHGLGGVRGGACLLGGLDLGGRFGDGGARAVDPALGQRRRRDQQRRNSDAAHDDCHSSHLVIPCFPGQRTATGCKELLLRRRSELMRRSGELLRR
ncbi:hypothetical protein PIB19_07235 [Sphingomonas sp. 7/4-4]|uniref:hypothetical protein n=1 Tax=Sphingomonas sp. 7/4-4 TaxID=3018446 RepID=UPI0022F3D57A|nr:hypothetical protein [Sphingomonas sp. 7/4-4]WBY09141.1 hypothetical protein PIB19_07235 [Sphingomonas sp. 7/4-4]